MRRSAFPVLVLLALATASPAAALCVPSNTITPTADGPSPRVLEVMPQALVGFPAAAAGPASTLVFDTLGCEVRTPVPVGTETNLGCPFVEPGTYPYRVEGFGAGTGVVVVRAVDWVTLAASPRTVVFGQALTLSGTVYPGRACAPPGPEPPRVAVSGRASGGPAFRPSASALPRAGTDRSAPWLARVRPWIRTEYRAAWQGRATASVVVDVRPRVGLRRRGGGDFAVSVQSLRGYRGRWIAVQRRTSRGWRFVRSVRLGAGSSARFRLPDERGSVRAFLPGSQAGRGYVAGFSPPLRLR